MVFAVLLLAFVAGGVSSDAAPDVRLASFELTALSPARSEGRAVLTLVNRSAAAISGVAGSCRVRVHGQEIGSGAGKRGKLRPGKKGALAMVFRVDRDRFLAAAGGGWAVGAPVDAELEGSLTLRLSSGDVSVPFRFAERMGTDGARSGVFSHPDGATSLSSR